MDIVESIHAVSTGKKEGAFCEAAEGSFF